MENFLYVIGIIVAVEGALKAIEYAIDKITKQHDKVQQIDENADSLEEYKKKTDAKLEEIDQRVTNAHTYATTSLAQLERNLTNVINTTMDENKKEYLKRIEDVEDSLKQVENSITQMSAVYQQTVAVVDVKIENLEKAQNKHNNFISRLYEVEKKTDVQTEQIKVANHRIEDLEKR